MVMVVVGSETYGSVKKVGANPIVTRFAMLSHFPVWPLESYYFEGFGARTSEGIPFLHETHQTPIHGIRLARVDKLSVLMAFARGLFGALAIVGFMWGLVGLISYLGSEPMDELSLIMFRVAVVCFVLGTVLGLCTYLTPFQMTRREKTIRRLSGTILGVCADPARVRPDFAAALASALDESPDLEILSDDGNGTGTSESPSLVEQLVRTRLQIALGESRVPLEDRTDELLESIRLLEHPGVRG